jgi:hypothetical protein
MMMDELNIKKETIRRIWTSGSSGHSHHAKASSTLVKTILSFLIAFFSFLRRKLPSKERDIRMLKTSRKP